MQIINKNDQGYGMTLAVLNIPSCEEIDFNTLEKSKSTWKVDYFEVREHNTQVVFYWRFLKPNETKEQIQFTFKKYDSAACIWRPHKAYLYYDEDGSQVWKK